MLWDTSFAQTFDVLCLERLPHLLQTLGDLGDAFGVLHDPAPVQARHVVGVGQAAQQELGAGEDGGQRIVDLVVHRDGDGEDSLQFSRAQSFVLSIMSTYADS
jgi:hypothetical protein